jgi:hypothetical protein
LTHCCGLEVQKPTQAEKYAKDGKVLVHSGFNSMVLSGPLTDLSAWVGFCTSSPQQGVKYQLCVKGPDNTFDLSPKWARTLPYLISFSWDIYRDPPSTIVFSNIKVDI